MGTKVFEQDFTQNEMQSDADSGWRYYRWTEKRTMGTGNTVGVSV